MSSSKIAEVCRIVAVAAAGAACSSTRSASTSKPRAASARTTSSAVSPRCMSWSAASGHERAGRARARRGCRGPARTASTSSSLNVARSSSSRTRAQRLGGAPAQRQQLGVGCGAQPALEAPVALHDEVVVDVLGVEVRGPERVVVGRDRAEAREQEVGAGQQQRQRVRGAPDVGGRHQRVVAGARLEVVHHHAEVLGDHLAHAVGHRARSR